MTTKKEQEKKLRDLANSIEHSLKAGGKSSDIVADLTSLGMERKLARRLVFRIKKNIFINSIPLPMFIGARETVMFFGFVLAGFIVSIIASFILSILASIFNLIPGIGKPVAIVMKIGEKIIGGVLGLGFAAFATSLGTIAGAIGAFIGSAIAVLLIVYGYMW